MVLHYGDHPGDNGERCVDDAYLLVTDVGHVLSDPSEEFPFNGGATNTGHDGGMGKVLRLPSGDDFVTDLIPLLAIPPLILEAAVDGVTTCGATSLSV